MSHGPSIISVLVVRSESKEPRHVLSRLSLTIQRIEIVIADRVFGGGSSWRDGLSFINRKTFESCIILLLPHFGKIKRIRILNLWGLGDGLSLFSEVLGILINKLVDCVTTHVPTPSLILLVDTQLSWDLHNFLLFNIVPRIPFLPLHLLDLIRIHGANARSLLYRPRTNYRSDIALAQVDFLDLRRILANDADTCQGLRITRIVSLALFFIVLASDAMGSLSRFYIFGRCHHRILKVRKDTCLSSCYF